MNNDSVLVGIYSTGIGRFAGTDISTELSVKINKEIASNSEEIACKSDERLRVGNNNVSEIEFGGRQIRDVNGSE